MLGLLAVRSSSPLESTHVPKLPDNGLRATPSWSLTNPTGGLAQFCNAALVPILHFLQMAWDLNDAKQLNPSTLRFLLPCAYFIIWFPCFPTPPFTNNSTYNCRVLFLNGSFLPNLQRAPLFTWQSEILPLIISFTRQIFTESHFLPGANSRHLGPIDQQTKTPVSPCLNLLFSCLSPASPLDNYRHHL